MNHEAEQIVAVRMVVIPNDHRNYKFYDDYLPYYDRYLLAIDNNQRCNQHQMIIFQRNMMVPVSANDIYSRYQQYKHLARPISDAGKLYQTDE